MPISKLAIGRVTGLDCNPRGGTPIRKIIVHHMAGVATAKNCATYHRNVGGVSANYYIGYNGEIIQGCDENERSWCSSNRDADYQAITIECSNSSASDPAWPVSDKTWKALVALCADLCKRYNIKPTWTGGTDGSFTAHYMYAATGCPGPYIKSRFPRLIQEVTAAIQGASVPEKYELTNKEQVYNVKEKDTWKSIAKMFGMTDNGVALLEYNNYATANEKIAEKVVTQKTVKIPPKFVPGDVDGDGKVEAADARTALRASAKLETLDPDERMRADIDGDGKVTAADARKILRKSAGLKE